MAEREKSTELAGVHNPKDIHKGDAKTVTASSQGNRMRVERKAGTEQTDAHSQHSTTLHPKAQTAPKGARAQQAEEPSTSNAASRNNASWVQGDQRKRDDVGDFDSQVFRTVSVTAFLDETVTRVFPKEDFREMQDTLGIRVCNNGKVTYLQGSYHRIRKAEKILLQWLHQHPQAIGTRPKSPERLAGKNSCSRLPSSVQNSGKNADLRPESSVPHGDKNADPNLRTREQSLGYQNGTNADPRSVSSERRDWENTKTNLQSSVRAKGLETGANTVKTRSQSSKQRNGANTDPVQEDGKNADPKTQSSEPRNGNNLDSRSQLSVVQGGKDDDASAQRNWKGAEARSQPAKHPTGKNADTRSQSSVQGDGKGADSRLQPSVQHNGKNTDPGSHASLRRDEKNRDTRPKSSLHHTTPHSTVQHNGKSVDSRPQSLAQPDGKNTAPRSRVSTQSVEINAGKGSELVRSCSSGVPSTSQSNAPQKPRHSYPLDSNTKTERANNQVEPSPETDVEVVYRARQSEINVHVYCADITKLKVDGIASAANPKLKFGRGGGVSGAIGKAGGNELKKACDKWVKKNGKLKVAETVLTQAGRLPCRAVIHALGPCWADYRDISTCLSDLHHTFINCLWAAEENKLSSVAIPAISSGSFGVPQKYVSQILYDACKIFCGGQHPRSQLRHIHLVDFNEEHVKQMRTYFGGDTAVFKIIPTANTTIENGARTQQAPKNSGANNGPGNKQQIGTHAPIKNGETSSAITTSSLGTSSGARTKTQRPQSMQPPSKNNEMLKASATTDEYSNGSKAQPSHQNPQRPQRRSRKNAGGSDTPGHNQDARRPDEGEDEECPICLEVPTSDEKTQLPCRHIFCKSCKDQAFALKPVCPVCGAIYGVLSGTQPDGKMKVEFDNKINLPGFRRRTGAIVITYTFRDGIQEDHHPNPGRPYRGTTRTAYLPDNDEGKHVLGLLRQAFDARLIFTIGTSTTTGRSDQVTWNDIHHKTTIYGGPASFGYPDPTYLARVKDELAAKGIK